MDHFPKGARVWRNYQWKLMQILYACNLALRQRMPVGHNQVRNHLSNRYNGQILWLFKQNRNAKIGQPASHRRQGAIAVINANSKKTGVPLLEIANGISEQIQESATSRRDRDWRVVRLTVHSTLQGCRAFMGLPSEPGHFDTRWRQKQRTPLFSVQLCSEFRRKILDLPVQCRLCQKSLFCSSSEIERLRKDAKRFQGFEIHASYYN